jgi:hypothetical protein
MSSELVVERLVIVMTLDNGPALSIQGALNVQHEVILLKQREGRRKEVGVKMSTCRSHVRRLSAL